MAKLADAADLKSAGPKGLWGFKSPSRHQGHTLLHFVQDFASRLRRRENGSTSLRSGFRLRAPASLMPAMRLNVVALTTRTVQNNRLIADVHDSAHEGRAAQRPTCKM